MQMKRNAKQKRPRRSRDKLESWLKKRLLVKSRKDLRLNKQNRNVSVLKKRGLLWNRI